MDIRCGFLWFVFTTGLAAYLAKYPPADPQNSMLKTILDATLLFGSSLGSFIAPVLRVALIIMILVAAAERFGLTKERRDWAGFAARLRRRQSRPRDARD